MRMPIPVTSKPRTLRTTVQWVRGTIALWRDASCSSLISTSAGLTKRHSHHCKRRRLYSVMCRAGAENEVYEDDGTLKPHSFFKYDSRGNVVEGRQEGPFAALLRFEYQYDDLRC